MIEIVGNNVVRTINLGRSTIRKVIDQLYHIKLTTDKETITANGTDTATIQAKIYNYLDEPQEQNITITVNVKGEGVDITDTYETVDGEVDIPFASNAEGDFVVTASYEGYRSGEVVVHAEN